MLAMRAIAALAVGTAMMFESWTFIMPHQAPTDTLILVNKTNRAPAVPVTLVKPNVTPTKESLSENIYMQPEAAAALEALFGWLWLKGRKERINELFCTMMEE